MAQQAAPGLSRSFAFRRDDSAEDLTAKVRAADEAVALARAEQQAASDRLAREEAALSKGVGALALRLKPPEWLAVKTGESLAARLRTGGSSGGSTASGQDDKAVLPGYDLGSYLGCGSTASQQNDEAVLAAGKLLPEVVAHDDFIGRTGVHGGWHPQDAADFDRAVTAARRNYSHAIRICVDTMLNVTEAEIRAHACWHREMTDLAAGKRDALDRWRSARRTEREAAAAAAADRQAAEAAAAQAAAKAEQQTRRRSTKEAISQWRSERAEAEAEAAAAEAAAAEQRAAEEHARRNAQQRERRASLQPFLAEKEAQAAAAAEAAAAAAAAQKPRLTSEALERVRGRQEITELRQRAALEEAGRVAAMQRERKHRLKQQLASSVMGKVPRDPERLLQPTATARKRTEARCTTGSVSRDSGYIRHVSRRATAGWTGGG